MLLCCGLRGRRTLPLLNTAFPNRFNAVRNRSNAAAVAADTWQSDSIDLQMGVSGRVNLDIYSPLTPLPRGHGPRNVLVHLPPGPMIASTTRNSIGALSQLQSLLQPATSVVRINYTLGNSPNTSVSPTETAVFPTPIHEVTAALDYLTLSTSPFNRDQDEPPRVCLLGSHIGGALALMLALTEPNSIHALAVMEPMVDWVGLDGVLEQLRAAESLPKTSAQKQAQRQAQRQAQKGRFKTRFGADNRCVIAAVEELITLRSKLFKTPSAYFDPFASPMMFLRAPGRDTPLATTVGDELVSEMGLDEVDGGYGRHHDSDAFGPYDDDWQPLRPSGEPSSSKVSSPGGLTSTGEANTATKPEAEAPPRRRKVLRRWPAVGIPEDVTLPHVQIFVQSETNHDAAGTKTKSLDLSSGHAALMRAQGREMSELMRRACFIGREKSFAEERVQLRLCTVAHRPDRVGTSTEKDALEWLREMFTKD